MTPVGANYSFHPDMQGLLKKHEAFETDFTVHRDRVNDVCANGDELINKVRLSRGSNQRSRRILPAKGLMPVNVSLCAAE